ncbi:galactitol-1-phosphate 5-dehydrogenase [Escherichia coli]
MKSVVNDTDGIVRVAESVIPEIKHQDEVRVKIASSGLCGSDLPRIFKNGAHYYPITLGHEFSGYIDAVGSGVDDLHPGDAVACVPLLPCFTCPECLKGFYSQCAKYDFIGSRRDGGFAEYIVVKRKNVFALPTDMPIEDGAFIEPITVGLHAFHLAQGCENKNVIIIGAGTIGLLAIQCAVALGAKSVTAIDISSEKLALAKSFGAMQTFNSSEMSAPQTVELAVEIAGPHAQLALVGTLHQDLHLTSATFGKILRKELTVIGSWMNYSSPWPGQEWETASRLLTERKLSLEPLIAHRGSFESFAQAVRDIARNAMPGKVLLIP